MDLISLLVAVVLLGLFFWVVWWFIGWVGIPEPFHKIAKVVLGLIVLLVLLDLVFGLGMVNLPKVQLNR